MNMAPGSKKGTCLDVKSSISVYVININLQISNLIIV